jgi:luciferase family oxidoreductase group 1
VRLSVLDQSPVLEGSTSSDALRSSIDLARLADRLGYHRYWVAEHHGGGMVAGASPEALIGPIASATSARMRVGSGGVMLPHYSPLKVAETFGVLAGLFPGRIDLGIGRASGTDPMTAHALQRDRRTALPDDFPQQLAELLAYLEDGFPGGHPFARLAALPGSPERPVPWLLGSSAQSAIWAAQLGLGYAFADFINPNGAEIAAEYRARFAHGDRRAGDAPRQAVAAWVLVADSEEEAIRLAASARMTFTLLRRGRLIPVPPPDRARRFLESEGTDPAARSFGARREILGTPASVRAQLEQLAGEYGAEEVIAVTIVHDHEVRRRSYELLAEAFGLELTSSPAPAVAFA